MYIKKVEVENFRLLKKAELRFERKTTVIVGRNNSGKTSLTELFRRLLAEKPVFHFEDFSLSVHDSFWDAFVLRARGAEEQEVRKAIPSIRGRLTVSYEAETSNLGHLADFVIDLNPDCADAVVEIRYELKDGGANDLFKGIDYDDGDDVSAQKSKFCRAIRDRIANYYEALVFAVDPNDPTNEKKLEWRSVRALFCAGFINAQRGLGEETLKNKNVLGGILETLFQTASSGSADSEDKEIALGLEMAVQDIQDEIDETFNKQLSDLLPAFSLFGYPGLSDPELQTETTLDVKRLLSDHTKVQYPGINGVNLPEAYNGLGTRNLIFILLKLLEFYKSYLAKEAAPGLNIVFIEEPEVHLHPQMQEVFIGRLNEIAQAFAENHSGAFWPVQFVVTTHSSHMANKASFDSIRYFFSKPDEKISGIRRTEVKDLGETDKENREFLHKYMTLTCCDLLFADKAILIEGITERLLLPEMIKKVDAKLPATNRLGSQYVSVLEVGGAYAHKFFSLLNFLELRTLIITDLDSIKPFGNGSACKVSEGTHTSNACIKAWFKDQSVVPAGLVKEKDERKVDGIRRIAYQVPEKDGSACGRSFEGAFILANEKMFGLNGASETDKEEEAWTLAKDVGSKADFALKHAIVETDWIMPRYIGEGLRWLAGADLAAKPAKPLTLRVKL